MSPLSAHHKSAAVKYAMNIYYVYKYLREDGTPYYIGKGKGNRAYNPDHTVKLPPRDRIRFVIKNISEADAHTLEKELILLYGRKDLGTGILRNLTEGGEGATPGPTVRAKYSAAKKGKKPNNYGKKCNYPSSRKWDRSGDKHPLYGVGHTDEARAAISAGIKAGWDRPVQTCPHCGKQGKVGMTRWHFDNCRHKAS